MRVNIWGLKKHHRRDSHDEHGGRDGDVHIDEWILDAGGRGGRGFAKAV